MAERSLHHMESSRIASETLAFFANYADRMTHLELHPDRRAFGWGIAATIVSAVGILPISIVILLMVTIDQNYGWLLIIVMPLSALIGAVGAVLGIVGLCFAFGARRTYAWPVVGVALGALQFIGVASLLTGARG